MCLGGESPQYSPLMEEEKARSNIFERGHKTRRYRKATGKIFANNDMPKMWVKCCARIYLSVSFYRHVRVYEMDDDTIIHKDRTARVGSKSSGREASAFEVELFVAEGEEEDTDDVVNRDENELVEDAGAEGEGDEVGTDEDAVDFAEDSVGKGGSDVSTEPKVMVVAISFEEVWATVVGMAIVAVAEARGEENEPDIPLRLV